MYPPFFRAGLPGVVRSKKADFGWFWQFSKALDLVFFQKNDFFEKKSVSAILFIFKSLNYEYTLRFSVRGFLR